MVGKDLVVCRIIFVDCKGKILFYMVVKRNYVYVVSFFFEKVSLVVVFFNFFFGDEMWWNIFFCVGYVIL